MLLKCSLKPPNAIHPLLKYFLGSFLFPRQDFPIYPYLFQHETQLKESLDVTPLLSQ